MCKINTLELIKVKAMDRSGAPIPNVIFLLLIDTGVKNQFSIRFWKTDQMGNAQLTEAEVNLGIGDCYRNGVSDYHWPNGFMPKTALVELINAKAFEDRYEILTNPNAYPKSQNSRWASNRESVDYVVSSDSKKWKMEPIEIDLTQDKRHEIILERAV